ncbi:MAG TPA: T9SS type A sorting domain-containing protein [Patescibacteria group bacterium]|nr:T9SS type A sorting domain-containing protein [Patescibacteria group bacterium]
MKQILMAVLCILLFGVAAEAHEGMIALFTDMDRKDRDDEIELYVIQDIYLFYVRGHGPDQLAAAQFRFLVSSPDVLIMNPEWPPLTNGIGDVSKDVVVVGWGYNLCLEWEPSKYFYLGTIPVINYGDPDTFTISVVAPIGYPEDLQICLCEEGLPTHPVIGDIFLFNGDYEAPNVVGAEARTQHSIELFFDKDLCPASAHLLSNYYISHAGDPDSPLPVTGTLLTGSGTSVLVSLGEDLVWNQSYVVDAGGIKDVNGYTILYEAPGSEITFVASENTATMLLGFAVDRLGESIAISWELAGMDEGICFRVLRAEAPALEFIELPEQDFSVRGLEFVYEDKSPEPGTTYQYRIEYIDGTDRRVLFETGEVTVPALRLMLAQNVPNPFNPMTSIRYVMPENGYVHLEVYDVTGRHIRTLVDEFRTKGTYTVDWNGIDGQGNPASSGVYFYRLFAGKQILNRKMVLLR